MYLAKDATNDKAISVVYNASSLPIERQKNDFIRYRAAVLQHIKGNKASHACCIVDNEGIVVWYVSFHSGCCFVPAIEAWLQSVSASDDPATAALKNSEALLAIPLDKRVYLAKISRGLVYEESCYLKDKACGLLADKNRGTLFVIDTGGRTQADLEQFAQPSKHKIALRAHRFVPVWQALLRQKILRAQHAIPFVAAALIIAFLAYPDPVKIVTQPLVGAVLATSNNIKIKYNASARIGELTSWLSRTKPLSSQATSLELTSESIKIEGAHAQRYPHPAAAFAKNAGASFQVQADGWTIFKSSPDQSEYQNVGQFSYADLLQRMYRIGRAVGNIRLVALFEEPAILGATLELQMNRPTTRHFEQLANQFKDRPVEMIKTNCGLYRGHAQNCIITIRIKGAST